MASNSVHLRAFDRGSSIITSVDLGHFSKKKLRKVSFLLLSSLKTVRVLQSHRIESLYIRVWNYLRYSLGIEKCPKV